MKKTLLKTFILFFLTSYQLLWAQTNPAPQSLPYAQNFDGLLANSTVYPAGWQGWTVSTAPSASFNTNSPTADRALVASSSASTNSGNVHNYNGKIGFLNTGSLDLSLVLSINTSSLQNIKVNYDISTIRNPYDGSANDRINEVILQYRVGTSGSFTNVPNSPLYQNNTTAQTGAGVTTPQNNLSLSVILPQACENKSEVQLRWISRQVSGGGSRPSFAIDNVDIAPINTPTITALPNALNFISQTINTTSAEKSFTLNYTNLDGTDVTLNTNAPFSISKTSGGTFSNTLTYTQADLNSTSTTIYVKYAPTVEGNSSGNITISGGGTLSNTILSLNGYGMDPNFAITGDYTQDFNDVNFLANSYWTQVSAKGNVKTWEYTASQTHAGAGAAYMNGFGETETDVDGNQPSDDWLISPRMNLTAFANFPIVSFWNKKNYVGPDIKLYISTTYNGNGVINLADWTELTNVGIPSTTGTWIQSNNIDLSAYKTANTYLAFRYVTDNSGSSNAAEWRVDDFSLTNKTSTYSIPKNTIVFNETAAGGTSASKNFSFSSSGYGDITLTAPQNFELSTDDITFASTVIVPSAEAATGKTIYARFIPTSTAVFLSDKITFSGTGLTVDGPQLKGSSLLKANTFDLVSWNMEFFGNGTAIPGYGPANRTLQINNAAIVYNTMLPDVIGIQEVSDEAAVDELLTKLPSTYKKKISQVYSYSIKPSNSTDPYPAQKVGFIYNSATVDTVGFRVMFLKQYKDAVNVGPVGTITDSFWSSGRLPFMGIFNVTTLDGLKKRVNVVVIHAKSGSAAADNSRRTADVAVLKDSLALYYPDNVAIVGDYNDLVEGSIASGKTSPYKILTDNGYKALTLPLLQAGEGTFVGGNNPSMIDNIIVSNDLVSLNETNSTAIEDAREYISGYKSNTSDHLPVYTRFTFPIGTLPIKVANFDVKAKGAIVEINWSTATETNNSYFTIKRSVDGKNFTAIKTIPGAGNSNQLKSYTTIDNNAPKGTVYYRLTQTDFDNNPTDYPEVRSVNIFGTEAFSVYPNPVKNQLFLSYESTSTNDKLVLSGVDGKVILTATGTNEQITSKVNSKLNTLTTGVYILKLTTGNKTYQSKLIKQ
ncbi:T9SS-dependent choice-of-anchor J family protein [Pedobacter montanisoli]|uniref:Choice-of-anchor J domain-containing protein n=1 Tax=Pedobacter montanisoli TaxID=2923277 RepID=A0ABS9ZXH4_9SPHI|nr:choice-of-anchor J domain-containing protein [Pedobacter montanisoli]MCJ0743013.1 choice-of-anchor J domain-containing protein [Pedobacter montanisoli]